MLIETLSCEDNALYPLPKQDVVKALSLEGDTFYVELSYEELQQDIYEEKIALKTLEALSIILCFEDDGTQFEKIATYTKYLYNNTQEEQHLQFGIKKVDTLSQYPVKILFSGILPINRLEIAIETSLYEFIQQHYNILAPKFKQLRQQLSQEIQIPILPVKHYADTHLEKNQISLINAQNNQTVCECKVNDKDMETSQIIDDYLQKLFIVYKKLATQ